MEISEFGCPPIFQKKVLRKTRYKFQDPGKVFSGTMQLILSLKNFGYQFQINYFLPKSIY